MSDDEARAVNIVVTLLAARGQMAENQADMLKRLHDDDTLNVLYPWAVQHLSAHTGEIKCRDRSAYHPPQKTE